MNKISDYLFRCRTRAWNWLLMHWHWLAKMRLYVIADSNDNSVTFSKDLFRMLDVMDKEQAKVYVFKLSGITYKINDAVFCPRYAFTINPTISEDTQLADIQYNQKHRCIGFECLVPTVNQIFYDYGLPAFSRAKLSVLPAATGTDIIYYTILPPKR